MNIKQRNQLNFAIKIRRRRTFARAGIEKKYNI